MENSRLILITGPTKSGKSEWAEKLAHQSLHPVIYLATAATDPSDQEWQARILAHQQRRPQQWQTIQAPIDLVKVIEAQPTSVCLLIDALGTWLTNLLEQDPPTWDNTRQQLLSALQTAQCQIIVVGEETGWGVVPAYPLGRLFRDRMGELLRQVGAIADPVYLVSAGYAVNIKALGTYVPPFQPPNTTQVE